MRTIIILSLFFIWSQAIGQPDSNELPTGSKQIQKDTSTKTEKIEIVNKSLDNLVTKLTEKNEDSHSIWDVLIPLLIGAGLTFGTQFVIELWKTNKEKDKKKVELIARGRAKTYLITQILKDLAMYKVHKQYYIKAYRIDHDEDSFKKQYEKGQQQRETETKLDDNIADYFELVTEYFILTKNVDHFQQHFESIFHYTHPKSSKFENCNTEEETMAELEIEEARLNEEYKKLTDIFATIQASLK